MTDTEQPAGMYSETAADMWGTVTWADADGKEYEITAYCEPSKYRWPDAVVVCSGPMRWVRGSVRGFSTTARRY